MKASSLLLLASLPVFAGDLSPSGISEECDVSIEHPADAWELTLCDLVGVVAGDSTASFLEEADDEARQVWTDDGLLQQEHPKQEDAQSGQ